MLDLLIVVGGMGLALGSAAGLGWLVSVAEGRLKGK